MTPLSAFGLFAVTAMLVTYALEQRTFGRAGFAVALRSARLRLLQGVWPWGVEAIWRCAVAALVHETRRDLRVSDPSRLG